LDLPPLQILFEDNHCLAIAKPAGALTTGYSGGEETLDRQVKAYLKEKHHKPGNVFLGVVHRLDRPVTGVLLFARNSKAAGRLAEQFREGQVTKTYWAIVAGRLDAPKARLRDWLWKDQLSGIVNVVKAGAPDARLAELDYETLGSGAAVCWLAVAPLTGRTHQIRVQLASRGHPILGDQKYHSTHDWPGGIALHARSLTFLHPISYEPTMLTAPLPESWQRGKALGLELPDE
jgi:23S rRNA pseudouridine1911/1915/1917 synthase